MGTVQEPVAGEKPFLLFATPRSGSCPVYDTFLKYFGAHRRIQGLGEIFNFDHSMWSEKGQVVVRAFPKLLNQSDWARLKESPGLQQIYRSILDYRRALIAPAPDQFFFKVFPSHLPLDYVPWLQERFEWIFLERKNLFHQLLSFLISFNLNQWYEPGGILVPARSVTATEQQVRGFEWLVWIYQYVKRIIHPRIVVTYEDFRSRGPAEFLKQSGFTGKWNPDALVLPEIQNKTPKEEAFTNLNQIQEWYEKSVLNQLSPLYENL